MTNRKKFIQMMNDTFNAELSENDLMPGRCTPCGMYKRGACNKFTCDGCGEWWDKEYAPPSGSEKRGS